MIFTYHHIGNNSSSDENHVSISAFKKQLNQLKRLGLKGVRISDYDPDNKKHAVITFDDGYADILQALPILKKYGFPFEIYIVGDWFNQDGFIGTKDVSIIKRCGGHLQWHTKTHCNLTKTDNVLDELIVPDDLKCLDKDGFTSLAYPFWETDDRIQGLVAGLFKNARAGNKSFGNKTYALNSIKVKEETDMQDKIVKFIDVTTPSWPCNFRCHYCYVGQHMSDSERSCVHNCKYGPDQLACAINKKRMGGTCAFNFCAFGETLILPQNVEYCKKILEQGHFLSVVTNMTITKSIDELLALPSEYLSRLFFKCSFHYMELKKQNMLELFTDNVNRAWAAGASITIEITPSDELEQYIDELKEYSLKHFGALPHVTIGRNELLPGYVRLTKHTADDYNKIWGQFDSDLFRFKNSIWEHKIKDFCYAGKWVYGLHLDDGQLYTCSHRQKVGDLLRGRHLKQRPVCNKCPAAHCFNGHAWLAWGACPEIHTATYADLRDRVRLDGTHWLHERVKGAFSQSLWENNRRYPKFIERLLNHLI